MAGVKTTTEFSKAQQLALKYPFMGRNDTAKHIIMAKTVTRNVNLELQKSQF